MIKQRLTLALAISAAMTGLTTLSSYAADLDVVAAKLSRLHNKYSLTVQLKR